MRPDFLGALFVASAVVSFNAALWQISRRSQKKRLLDNHKNISEAPMKELPTDDSSIVTKEFSRVELEGSFDNEGSVLVGPRPVPSYKGAANEAESKGGFIVMTPFEVANKHQFIMVHRGWVPVDAAKHRLLLAQYIGEGFKFTTLRGLLRREEHVASIWGPAEENVKPLAADLSWFVIRPFNMIEEYFSKRWGSSNVKEKIAQHGQHHYFVEMIEDFSGDDQRMVRGHVWPRRRDVDEMTYVHLTPQIHSAYTFFWLCVTVGSLYGAHRCYLRHKSLIRERQIFSKNITALEDQRRKEAGAFIQAQESVVALKSEQASRLGST